MKKSGAAAYIHQLLVFTLVTICGSGSIGLGAVWLRHQISVTARDNGELESRLTDLRRRLDGVNAQVEAEQSTEKLKERNAQWNLGLVPLAPNDPAIIDVDGNPELMLAEKREVVASGDTLLANLRFQTPENR